MLVVIGIIAILTAACLVGYRKMLVTAEKTKCRELVMNAATALSAIYTETGAWPRALRNAREVGGAKVLDASAAYALARMGQEGGTQKLGYMRLEVGSGKTKGLDRFGLVTPFATAVVKRLGSKATLATKVTGDSTIEDHILRFAIDFDGDGKIEDVKVGGEAITIRANAVVWCCGRDGKILSFKEGVKSDDVHSWTKGQILENEE